VNIPYQIDDILALGKEAVLSSTTLTSKGQITLPKDIRDRLALKQGDRFEVAISLDGVLTLEREQPPPLERGFGMLQRLARRRTVSITEMRAAVRQRAKKKHSVKRA
jgi:antitoxin PrlF